MSRPRTATNSQSRQALYCATCKERLGKPLSVEAFLEEKAKETLQKILGQKFALARETRDDKQKSTKNLSFKGVKVMAGQYGVKNIADFLELGKVFTLVIVKASKQEGFSFARVLELLQEPELAEALKEAVKDMELVPFEARELDFFDGLALTRKGGEVIQAVLSEFKK